MLDMIKDGLETSPTMSAGDRKQFVVQTAIADDEAKLGKAPNPMPRWLGTALAWILEKVCSCCKTSVASQRSG
jgi:7-hydroxymethyl chlorophyll a reductase